MRKLLILFTILGLACNSADKPANSDDLRGIDSLQYSVMMGNTVLEEHPDIWSIDKYSEPHWAYTYGLISYAMLDLWRYTGDDKYYDYANSYIDALIDDEGTIKTYKKSDYNIDKINSGKVLFTFYKQTKDERYLTALKTLRSQLEEHPQTEIGGFWHKKRYPHQMWLDGLYMGGPFLAQYAVEFNEAASLDQVVNWYVNMEKVARDPETGLLYHGWDESHEQAWADPETGCSPNFWGRGMGWYAMALVDLLDYLPEDHPGYNSIRAIINRLAESIVKYQDPETGIWYQVVDQGNREGNYLEGSVAAMFSYFLLKCINKSYLDTNSYANPAQKAYAGMVENLIKLQPDSTLVITPVCAVAGLGGDPYRDGSYEYYINEMQRDNDAKAVGPFILASIQYEKLAK